MNLTNQATVNFTMINSDGSTTPLQQQSNITSTLVTPVVKNNYKLTPIHTTNGSNASRPTATKQQFQLVAACFATFKALYLICFGQRQNTHLSREDENKYINILNS